MTIYDIKDGMTCELRNGKVMTCEFKPNMVSGISLPYLLGDMGVVKIRDNYDLHFDSLERPEFDIVKVNNGDDVIWKRNSNDDLANLLCNAKWNRPITRTAVPRCNHADMSVRVLEQKGCNKQLLSFTFRNNCVYEERVSFFAHRGTIYIRADKYGFKLSANAHTKAKNRYTKISYEIGFEPGDYDVSYDSINGVYIATKKRAQSDDIPN